MSEPKRYSNLDVWKALHFGENDSGWVKWEDYACIKAEVEKLNARWLHMLDENKDLRQTNRQYHQVLSANRNLEAEVARLKAEVERLTEIIDSFKTMPIIEGQSFNGWKLDEHHRLVSLVESLRAGSIDGAKQFTHKEYRDFQKTMIEKNAAKEVPS